LGSAGRATVLSDGDASDQRMLAISTQLEAGAADHPSGLISIDPQVNGRLVKTSEREVGIT
jgi:hypothetical protein